MKDVLVEINVLVPSGDSQVVDFHYLARENITGKTTQEDLDRLFTKVRKAVARAQKGERE